MWKTNSKIAYEHGFWVKNWSQSFCRQQASFISNPNFHKMLIGNDCDYFNLNTNSEIQNILSRDSRNWVSAPPPSSSLQQIVKLGNRDAFFLGRYSADLSIQNACVLNHFINSACLIISFYAVIAIPSPNGFSDCDYSSNWPSSILNR